MTRRSANRIAVKQRRHQETEGCQEATDCRTLLRASLCQMITDRRPVCSETIAVAGAEGGGKVQALGTIPNRPEAVRRLLGKVRKPGELRVCHEPGPTGYALYWQLTALRSTRVVARRDRVRSLAPGLAMR